MKAKKGKFTRENGSHVANSGELPQSEAKEMNGSKMAVETRGYAKSDSRYWLQEGKLQRDLRSSPNLFCRIQWRGRREFFPLSTPNVKVAAPKAAAIYRDVVATGWGKALAKHKPDTFKAKGCTVGDLIAAVSELATCRPDTLRGNVSTFRRIVADVEGIKADAARFARCGDGRAAWLAALDSVPLAKLTPDRVEAWKLRFVSQASGDEIKSRAARNSANTMLRQGKSLFTKRLRHFFAQRLELPSRLPFDGVAPFPRQSMRYASTMDVHALLTAATGKLAVTDPEAFKAFLLCLFGGLRRNECDKLRWSSLDFTAGAIRIEAHSDFSAKCETSLADVPIDPEVCALLQGLRAKEPKAEYVLQGEASKVNTSYRAYRATETFARLATWLRSNGVTGRAPLHTLRKEAGSLVCAKAGLFAASRFLRHADVAITAQHYTAQKERVTLGFAGLLAKPKNVTPADFTKAPTEKGLEPKGRKAHRRATA